MRGSRCHRSRWAQVYSYRCAPGEELGFARILAPGLIQFKFIILYQKTSSRVTLIVNFEFSLSAMGIA